MSELKVIDLGNIRESIENDEPVYYEYYAKSEVDKVIEELKKEKEYVIENTAEIINAQKRELRYQKYKRCLNKAELCEHERIDAANDSTPIEKWKFYDKWNKRWLKIAEQFKE